VKTGDAPSEQPKEDVVKPARVVKPQAESPADQIVPTDIEKLRWIVQETQLEIARRAYELFEARGCAHGHDWEDWFRAESELLRPLSVVVSENPEQISVRVNVLGFERNELKIGVESQCITIFGKKNAGAIETEGGKIEYIHWYPDEILKSIDLPGPIAIGRTAIVLRRGILSFELPKSNIAAGFQAA
jgi:HSP20 family protein